VVRLDRIGLEMTTLKRESWGNTYSRKDVETRLRWFEHVERRPIDYVVRRVDDRSDEG
jgi:hypothetical protein